MHFTQVKLRNFGPFSNAKFEFEIGRVNGFIGNNGAGKTQMVGAMLAAIVGQPALFITPGGVGPSSVELLVEDGETVETVSLTVTENPQSKPDISKTTGALTLQVLATMSERHGQRLLVGHDHEAGITPMHFKG